jgi:hypothetical protein
MSARVDVIAIMMRDAIHADVYRAAHSSMLSSEANKCVLYSFAARAAVAELIYASNYAYPPGDYSQDAHGFAVRKALDNIGPAS